MMACSLYETWWFFILYIHILINILQVSQSCYIGAQRASILTMNAIATAAKHLVAESPLEQLESDLMYLASNSRIVHVIKKEVGTKAWSTVSSFLLEALYCSGIQGISRKQKRNWSHRLSLWMLSLKFGMQEHQWQQPILRYLLIISIVLLAHGLEFHIYTMCFLEQDATFY